MKKLIAFLTLLLCVSFTEMSAQTVLRWSVNTDAGPASLKILINNVVVVDVNQAGGATPQSGIITGLDNDVITYYANSTGSAPFICASTETDLVNDYFAGAFDAYGQPVDGYIYSESWSWNSYDDYDFTIDLRTYTRLD